MPEVPVTTNNGDRTKGRSLVQCGHRNMSATAGVESGKALRPQASHVNGTQRSCRRLDPEDGCASGVPAADFLANLSTEGTGSASTWGNGGQDRARSAEG